MIKKEDKRNLEHRCVGWAWRAHIWWCSCDRLLGQAGSWPSRICHVSASFTYRKRNLLMRNRYSANLLKDFTHNLELLKNDLSTQDTELINPSQPAWVRPSRLLVDKWLVSSEYEISHLLTPSAIIQIMWYFYWCHGNYFTLYHFKPMKNLMLN